MPTENGGRTIGRPDVGALRKARGDLVLVDLARLRRADGAADPLELALATAHADELRIVISAGRLVAERGVSRIDVQAPAATAHAGEALETVRDLLPLACEHYRAWGGPRAHEGETEVA